MPRPGTTNVCRPSTRLQRSMLSTYSSVRLCARSHSGWLLLQLRISAFKGKHSCDIDVNMRRDRAAKHIDPSDGHSKDMESTMLSPSMCIAESYNSAPCSRSTHLILSCSSPRPKRQRTGKATVRERVSTRTLMKKFPFWVLA
jgi:hypothetical protein